MSNETFNDKVDLDASSSDSNQFSDGNIMNLNDSCQHLQISGDTHSLDNRVKKCEREIGGIETLIALFHQQKETIAEQGKTITGILEKKINQLN